MWRRPVSQLQSPPGCSSLIRPPAGETRLAPLPWVPLTRRTIQSGRMAATHPRSGYRRRVCITGHFTDGSLSPADSLSFIIAVATASSGNMINFTLPFSEISPINHFKLRLCKYCCGRVTNPQRVLNSPARPGLTSETPGNETTPGISPSGSTETSVRDGDSTRETDV
ncbi:hypothetical protein DPEC_G00019530 [Dallia pectoralis]|uniref:Uncharacterized protein n=1 Tax=Dallia pectoralis TaxID=75939 RepID=A0ACC2HGC7_DALPE|nr:hypothetical protein DPEC_G00019530 [Dallia pectoralis]